MQQLKEVTPNFITLVTQAPTNALTEFLTIIENTERTDTTAKIIEILKREISHREATKRNY
jgi:hypothetical protein